MVDAKWTEKPPAEHRQRLAAPGVGTPVDEARQEIGGKAGRDKMTMTSGIHHVKLAEVTSRTPLAVNRTTAAASERTSTVRVSGPTGSWAGGGLLAGSIVARYIG